jgi:hypothetical protein
VNLSDIPAGAYILFDPDELTKRPSEELPEQNEQVLFWPKGGGCPVGGGYMDGHWYQARVGKKNVNYSRYDGDVEYWMRIPQMGVKQ